MADVAAATKYLFLSDIGEAVVKTQKETQCRWIIFRTCVTPRCTYDNFSQFIFDLYDDIHINILQDERLLECEDFKLHFCLTLEIISYDYVNDKYFIPPNIYSFKTEYRTILPTSDLKLEVKKLIDDLTRGVNRYTNYSEKETYTVQSLVIDVCSYDPSKPLPALLPPKLPPLLDRKRSLTKIIGMRVGDSFYSATLSTAYYKLHPNKKGKGLPRSPSFAVQWENVWKRSELTAPIYSSEEIQLNVPLEMIDKFENENPNYRVLVITYDENEEKFIPLRRPRNDGIYSQELLVLALFYYEKYYFPIKDISGLCSDKGKNRHYVCPFCFKYFGRKDSLEGHKKICIGGQPNDAGMP